MPKQPVPNPYGEQISKLVGYMEKAGFDDAEDRNDMYDFVAGELATFPEYVNTVAHNQAKMPLVYALYDGQELRDRITEMDTRRHNVHETAISAINTLNRYGERLGMGKVFDVDTTDRQAVADFAGAYTSAMFDEGQHKTMDEIVLQNGRKEYDASSQASRSRLEQFNQRLGSKYDDIMQNGGSDGPSYHY